MIFKLGTRSTLTEEKIHLVRKTWKDCRETFQKNLSVTVSELETSLPLAQKVSFSEISLIDLTY